MPECKDRNSIYFTICLRFCKNIILLRRFFPFFLNFIKKIYPFLYLVKIRFRIRNIWRVNASKEEPFIFRAKKLQCEFPLEKSSARLFLSREDFPLFFFFFAYLMISHPCVLVSFLVPQGNMTEFKALVDHYETLARQFREKKKVKKLDPFNGLISPLYSRRRKDKKKGKDWILRIRIFIYYCVLFDTPWRNRKF